LSLYFRPFVGSLAHFTYGFHSSNRATGSGLLARVAQSSPDPRRSFMGSNARVVGTVRSILDASFLETVQKQERPIKQGRGSWASSASGLQPCAHGVPIIQ
jgi:hypothetical protein